MCLPTSLDRFQHKVFLNCLESFVGGEDVISNALREVQGLHMDDHEDEAG